MCFISCFKISLCGLIFLFFSGNCCAGIAGPEYLSRDSFLPVSAEMLPDSGSCIPAADSVKTHRKENKKLIAAILAFPVPFGVMGLHRIYLGTKPYMPFVYIGTVGGCFGILPLVDFITILTTKKEKIKNFENNRRVFMWSH